VADEDEEERPDFGGKMISIRSAMIAYAILAAIAFGTLKGPALGLALIVVFGAAAKSYVHYLRERAE
jgi:hypothetical protein